MIERHIAKHILKYAKQYPVIALVGTRQKGFPVEIKLSQTYTSEFQKTIHQWFKLDNNPADAGCVVYCGEQAIGVETPVPTIPWYCL